MWTQPFLPPIRRAHLTQVGRIGLVAADLLGGDDQVELGAQMAPEMPSSLSSTLEMIPISYRSLRRSIAAFASRKGGHDATLSGRNWAREGSIVQPISSAVCTAARRRTSA